MSRHARTRGQRTRLLLTLLFQRASGAIIALLFLGAFCNGLVISFMPWYIVTVLEQPPVSLTLYSSVFLVVSILANRFFGRRLDSGSNPAVIIRLTMLAMAAGSAIAALFADFWILVLFVTLCYGIGGGFIAAMYTIGRSEAGQQDWHIHHYNALLRAAVSTGWMVGPALAFGVASIWPATWVFCGATATALLGFVGSFVCLPARQQIVADKPAETEPDAARQVSWNLRLAAAVCFLFAIAHILCTSTLPLFYTIERGLPDYAPGLSFSVKTLMEIVFIMLSPALLARYNPRHLLAGTALLAMAAFAVLSQVDSLAGLVLGAAMEGSYYGLFAGIGIGFMQSFANGRLGMTTSLYMNSLLAGSIIAGPAIGLIGQYASFQASILAAAGGAGLALVLLLAWPKSLRTGHMVT